MKKDKVFGSAVGHLTMEDVNSFPQPDEWNLLPGIRFNYSYTEVKQMYELYSKKEGNSFEQFMVEMIPYCGICIGDEKALDYTKTIVGFKKGTRYYRIAGLIGTMRFTARVVPATWSGRYMTHFKLVGNKIFCDDIFLVELKAVFVGNSLRNIVYATKSEFNENILTVNPLQICAQYCEFCFKGMKNMLPDFKKTLCNYSAKEVIEIIRKEYKEYDFSKLTEFTILTARFQKYNQLIHYLSEFYVGMRDISKNRFNPCLHENQRIKVSTHLIDSVEKMNEVKRYGVKRLIYPVELFNNAARSNIMVSKAYEKGNNKGDVLSLPVT